MATIPVTADEVRNIITLSAKFTDPIINQCISMAANYGGAVLTSDDLTDSILHDIELYLSAHFCSIKEPQVIEEEWGGRDSIAKQKLNPAKLGQMLYATAFGQQAIMLDYTGTLAELSQPKRKIASFETIGSAIEGNGEYSGPE